MHHDQQLITYHKLAVLVLVDFLINVRKIIGTFEVAPFIILSLK